MNAKVQYEAPKLIEVGSFEEITKGNSSGKALDADFPEDTLFEDLEFS